MAYYSQITIDSEVKGKNYWLNQYLNSHLIESALANFALLTVKITPWRDSVEFEVSL